MSFGNSQPFFCRHSVEAPELREVRARRFQYWEAIKEVGGILQVQRQAAEPGVVAVLAGLVLDRLHHSLKRTALRHRQLHRRQNRRRLVLDPVHQRLPQQSAAASRPQQLGGGHCRDC